jgi:hypothetical protein
MRKLFVTLFVLAALGGLLYGADRFLLAMAEGQIAKQVAAEGGLQTTPEVTIHGFPFLTQVVAGQYDKITVNVGDVQQQRVKVSDVRTELRGVKAPLSDMLNGNTSNVVASTANVSGLLPFAVVEANAPQGMKLSASGGDLRIQGRLRYAGISAPVQATVSVKPSGSGIALTPRDVRSGGGRIPIPAALVRERLGFTIPLRSLPMGARVTSIEVSPQGLRMAATAENVKLAR